MLSRPIQQHLKHCLIVLADNSGEQINYLTPAKCGEVPDHSEVDQGDAIAGEIKHVARVRISVKEAVDQNHLEHGIGAACRQHLAVEVRSGDGREVSAANTGHILLDVHQTAGKIPIHFRDKNMRLTRKIASKAIDMSGLDSEVELSLQRTSKLGHDLDWRVAARLRDFVLDQVGKMVKKPQVR